MATHASKGGQSGTGQKAALDTPRKESQQAQPQQGAGQRGGSGNFASGNFAQDPERASEAGRKGGHNSHSGR
jgi:general stress protein YciG